MKNATPRSRWIWKPERPSMWISILNNRIANDSGWTILLVRNTVKNLLVKAVFGLASLVAMSRTCAAQQWLDQLETNLSLKNPSGSIRSDLTVLLDAEGYYVDQRPPGLIFDDESFINPRATFYIDTMLGSHLYSFVQARVDRGFDPAQKKDGYHYASGTYQIVSTKHEASGQGSSFSPFSPATGVGPVGDLGSADPVAGVVVANGPWFTDLDASVSAELKSAGGTGDLAVAAGLVFHLNDRGYYAVIVTASGSRKLSFKLVKKYHFQTSARDLSAWVDSPVSDLIAGSQKKIGPMPRCSH